MIKKRIKIYLWIFFIICSMISLFLSSNLSKNEIQNKDLKILINKIEILKKSKILFNKFHFFSNSKIIISLKSHNTLQDFIELKCGGKKYYSELIKKELINPYIWKIKFFHEKKSKEIEFYFSIKGGSLGFHEKSSENIINNNIKEHESLNIAKKQAELYWNINFTKLKLIKSLSDVKKYKNKNYTFIFKKKNQIYVMENID